MAAGGPAHIGTLYSSTSRPSTPVLLEMQPYVPDWMAPKFTLLQDGLSESDTELLEMLGHWLLSVRLNSEATLMAVVLQLVSFQNVTD